MQATSPSDLVPACPRVGPPFAAARLPEAVGETSQVPPLPPEGFCWFFFAGPHKGTHSPPREHPNPKEPQWTLKPNNPSQETKKPNFSYVLLGFSD